MLFSWLPVDWTIKNNPKLDKWTNEIFYDTFLFEYLRKEHPNNALERSFKEMQNWADETNNQFNDIFRIGSPNRICHLILNGRISPWIVYNCDSGVEFLSNLEEDQIKLIYKHIDPDFWSNKFKDFVADTEFIKSVLIEAKVWCNGNLFQSNARQTRYITPWHWDTKITNNPMALC